ncbi:hypothetical protein N7M99_12170 [Shouchella clausii]|jgi:gas vesicle protein|nr:hypothetical protein [Shouchella clausii]MBU3231231.1 hypothetical protein [Shouchella clausii]MBU3263765.1 hypothetical protein [Shouchella clausii]MBU3508273.1 hypothetical protein [Shouchella clausii]MBU3535800.1 hypothetical protein [Shouchella clausii]MBX0308492.1 hypothetical protein [Shouchella clausii]
MGATHAVTPAYFPLFARLSTLPANATVSPAILTRQLKQLVPIQYQWYQAQLRTQAIQTAVSEVAATGRSVLTEEEVAAMQAYLENNPSGDGPLIAEVDEEVYKDGRYPGPTKDARVGADGIAYRNDIGPIIAAAADFFFGDFLTLADPEASLGEKALATTFILVKPAKVAELGYDLSKVRKVETGGKGTDKTRPSWRQSEIDVGKEYPGYRDQVSYKQGNEVSHGTKNSSRPDFYIKGHSIEVKNYKVTTSSGRSNLIRNVSKQINKRISDLPEQTKQSVIIDVRGQNVSRDVLRDIKQKINERTNDVAEIIFKMD